MPVHFEVDYDRVRADRRRSVAEASKDQGLLEGGSIDVAASVPAKLLEEAKTRSGISSTEELVVHALAKLALEDDFGAKLVARSKAMHAGRKP